MCGGFVAPLVRVAPNYRATAARWVLLPANHCGEDPGIPVPGLFHACLLVAGVLPCGMGVAAGASGSWPGSDGPV